MMQEKRQSQSQNYFLLVLSILITYLILEAFMFIALPFMPLRLQGYLPRAVRLLAQSPKNGLKPENYIAIMGDSYAQGLGEWFSSTLKWTNPDYGSQHILHAQTGRDVITFGRGGAGSLGGMVTQPVNALRYLDRTAFLKIEKPRTILVYFYEGNDLSDNSEEIDERFTGSNDRNKLFDKDYFRTFIENVVIAQDRLFVPEIKSFRWYDNLVFLKMIKNIITHDKGISQDDNREAEKEEHRRNKRVGPGRINRFLMNGEKVFVPDRLQAPALDITKREIELGVYVFGESLDYLRQYFSNSKIFVVYIPSPLSCYEIVSPQVSIQTYPDRKAIHDAADVSRNNEFIRREIRRATEDLGLTFIDPTDAIRKTTRTEFLHGPSEWKHFNKRGYTVLTEAIVPYLKEE